MKNHVSPTLVILGLVVGLVGCGQYIANNGLPSVPAPVAVRAASQDTTAAARALILDRVELHNRSFNLSLTNLRVTPVTTPNEFKFTGMMQSKSVEKTSEWPVWGVANVKEQWVVVNAKYLEQVGTDRQINDVQAAVKRELETQMRIPEEVGEILNIDARRTPVTTMFVFNALELITNRMTGKKRQVRIEGNYDLKTKRLSNVRIHPFV